jgi:hypothetical protein
MTSKKLTAVGLVIVMTLAAASLWALKYSRADGQSATPTSGPSASATASPAPSPTPTCSAPIPFTDGFNLALEKLTAQSTRMLIDEASLRALGEEIDGALAQARSIEPQVQAIHVFPENETGLLVLGLEGVLKDVVSQQLSPGQTVTSLVTGNQEFDSLNSQLCLQKASYLFSLNLLNVFLSERLNAPLALDAYRQIDGVASASLSLAVGDGRDIAVQEQGTLWYVVFRDAYGDCPAGCISQTLYYFTVSTDGAREVCEDVALQDPTFRELATTWGAQRLPQTPRGCGDSAPDPPAPPSLPSSLPNTGGRP